MRRPLIIATMLSLFAGTPGAAQDMPRYNVAAHCQEDAKQQVKVMRTISGKEPDQAYYDLVAGACMREEEAAYPQLRRVWNEVPAAAILEMCHRHTGPSGMLRCIDAWKREKSAAAARMDVLPKLVPDRAALPQWDVDSTCRFRSGEEKEPGANYAACMARQQTSYDYLKPIWGRLPKDITVRCMWGHDGPFKYYWLLENCVNSELDKAVKHIAHEERERSIQKIPFRY